VIENNKSAGESPDGQKKTKSAASGRKPAYESRSVELRRSLVVWKQTPESIRPSLRALAAELGTSHQLLTYFLDGLEIWRARENHRSEKRENERSIRQIRDLAQTGGRTLTSQEKEQVAAQVKANLRISSTIQMLDEIEQIRRESRSWTNEPQ